MVSSPRHCLFTASHMCDDADNITILLFDLVVSDSSVRISDERNNTQASFKYTILQDCDRSIGLIWKRYQIELPAEKRCSIPRLTKGEV
jgi:hypothetical protein